MLDGWHLREWLELLDKEIIYQIPVRITRETGAGSGFSDCSWHMNEDYESLKMRVARLETEYAWAEDPPSRTRHFVTNVRVLDVDGDFIHISSGLLLYRNRYSLTTSDLLSAERRDTLHRIAGEDLKLVQRRVLLDQATLATHNLSIFL